MLVRDQPRAVGEIAQLLVADGVAADRADELAGLSRGRPGWAVRAAGDAEVLERHAAWTGRP